MIKLALSSSIGIHNLVNDNFFSDLYMSVTKYEPIFFSTYDPMAINTDRQIQSNWNSFGHLIRDNS